jgi:hypothetical protein
VARNLHQLKGAQTEVSAGGNSGWSQVLDDYRCVTDAMTQKSPKRWVLIALVNVLVLAFPVFLYVQAESIDARQFAKFGGQLVVFMLLVADIRSLFPARRH